MFIERKSEKEKAIENKNKPFKSKDRLKYVVLYIKCKS